MLSGLYEATALPAYRRQTVSGQLTTEFVSVDVGQDDTELSLLHLPLLQCLELPCWGWRISYQAQGHCHVTAAEPILISGA